jgi:hypothetical protein
MHVSEKQNYYILGLVFIILLASLTIKLFINYRNNISVPNYQKSLSNNTNSFTNSPTPAISVNSAIEIRGPVELTQTNEFATFHLHEEPEALRFVTLKFSLPENTIKTSDSRFVYSLDKQYSVNLSLGHVGYEIPGKHRYVSTTIYINGVKFTKEERFVDNKLMHIMYERNGTYNNTPFTLVSYIALPENTYPTDINNKAISTLEKIIGSIKIIDIKSEN